MLTQRLGQERGNLPVVHDQHVTRLYKLSGALGDGALAQFNFVAQALRGVHHLQFDTEPRAVLAHGCHQAPIPLMLAKGDDKRDRARRGGAFGYRPVDGQRDHQMFSHRLPIQLPDRLFTLVEL